jgi:hypothetical protein
VVRYLRQRLGLAYAIDTQLVNIQFRRFRVRCFQPVTPRDREKNTGKFIYAALWRESNRVVQFSESVSSHRERRRIMGAVDPRVSPAALEVLAPPTGSRELARRPGYHVTEVQWPVLGPVDQGTCGLRSEGLLLTLVVISHVNGCQ